MGNGVDQRAKRIRVLRELKKRRACRRWGGERNGSVITGTAFFLVTVYCVREKGLAVSGCVC